MKRYLENLDTVGVVTVERNVTASYGGYEWTITFDSELGNLPLLEVTTGRLGGHGLTGTVTELVPGSSATMVYEGSGMPAVKSFTAEGLVEDALYAFKVLYFIGPSRIESYQIRCPGLA